MYQPSEGTLKQLRKKKTKMEDVNDSGLTDFSHSGINQGSAMDITVDKGLFSSDFLFRDSDSQDSRKKKKSDKSHSTDK